LLWPFDSLNLVLRLFCAVTLLAFGLAWAGRRRPRLRRLALAVASLSLCLAFGEAWALGHISQRVVRTPEYIDSDPVLGYAPRPKSVATGQMLLGAEQIYKVTYAFDELGLRIHPHFRQPGAANVLFFGDSFTLGEGVEGDQSLPARFERLAAGRFAAHNFGFDGYGPHQMLACLQAGREAAPLVKGATPYVVHVSLPAHLWRVAGKVPWDWDGPRYVSVDGKAERRGNFMPAWKASLMAGLSRSAFFREYLYRSPDRPLPEDAQTYAAVLKSTGDLVRERYGAEFLVIVWGARGAQERLLGLLDQVGVTAIPISEIIPDIADPKYRLHSADPHPSPLAYQRVAEYLWNRLGPDPVGRPTRSLSPAP
jgi:hypothetical protein